MSRKSLRLRNIAFILMSLFLIQIAQAAPPLDFPSDGHHPDGILATGSVISIGSSNPGPHPEVAALFGEVAQFHLRINTSSQAPEDVAALGQTCLTCHSDVFSRETVLRKMPTEDGAIEVTEEKNHHQVHQKQKIMDFGTDCTFCHNEFQVTQNDDSVTISSYVEKTTCANCHSRFTPRELMDPTWRDLFGCPGCHQTSVPDTHAAIEFSSRYVKDDHITGVDCFACHADNPMQLPLWLQDQYWQNVVIDF
jgi:hypothetical protein